MALLEILHYPDERLRTVAKKVTDFNESLDQIISDMAETMYSASGIGLAATQVNHHIQLIVIDVSSDKNGLMVIINPTIIERHGVKDNDEGCLSVPGIYDTVTRAETIKIKYQDQKGHHKTLEAQDLLAICIQHELDHLSGKVFVDYLSRLKQTRIKDRFKKNPPKTNIEKAKEKQNKSADHQENDHDDDN